MSGPFGVGVTGGNIELTGGLRQLTINLNEIPNIQNAEPLTSDIYTANLGFGGRSQLNDYRAGVGLFAAYGANVEYGTGKLSNDLDIMSVGGEARLGLETEFFMGRDSSVALGANGIINASTYRAEDYFNTGPQDPNPIESVDGGKSLVGNSGFLAGGTLRATFNRVTAFGNYNHALSDNQNNSFGGGLSYTFKQSCAADPELSIIAKYSQFDLDNANVTTNGVNEFDPIDNASTQNISLGVSLKF